MGPRFKLSDSDTGFDWPTSECPVQSHHPADDQLGFKYGFEAELGHVLNKRFNTRLH
ncbi:MAG: hypothetical protein OXK78_17510 [Caldilineaceae bacterium]|nr:hypothetical protein [Caldilineaceae bacterium]